MLTRKEEIIFHYQNSVEWIKNLKDLSEDQWRTTVDRDKWTIAEVIGHFIPWDEFVLNQRIPYFSKDNKMPKSPDKREVNNRASIDSRRRSKEETIEKIIAVRRKLIKAVNELDDSLWHKEFVFGNSTLSLYNYFSGLVEHDEHHLKQIQKALRKKEV